MDSTTTTLTTGAGVTITRTAGGFDPARLAEIAALVDHRRGGVLSSGMEYPGRYTRWHLAYVNPPVEIATRGRQVTARALNDRGRVLMPVIADAMRRVGTEIADLPQDNSKKPDGVRRCGAGPADRVRGRRRRRVHRGGAVAAADGVQRAAGDRRRVRLRRPAPGAVRGVRLRPGVPVRAGPARAGPGGRPAGPGAAPAGRDLRRRPAPRGGDQVLLRVQRGRRRDGRPRAGDRGYPAAGARDRRRQ